MEVATLPPCVLLSSISSASFPCPSPPQPAWWIDTPHLNVTVLSTGSPLLLIRGTSCGWQQCKVRILSFLGVYLVWTFAAQQAYTFRSSIEATGRSIWSRLSWHWCSERPCEMVNKSWSLAIPNLTEELLRSTRVFIIKLQLLQTSWTQELGPSLHGPSSDSKQHYSTYMFCFYCRKKE